MVATMYSQKTTAAPQLVPAGAICTVETSPLPFSYLAAADVAGPQTKTAAPTGIG